MKYSSILLTLNLETCLACLFLLASEPFREEMKWPSARNPQTLRVYQYFFTGFVKPLKQSHWIYNIVWKDGFTCRPLWFTSYITSVQLKKSTFSNVQQMMYFFFYWLYSTLVVWLTKTCTIRETSCSWNIQLLKFCSVIISKLFYNILQLPFIICEMSN